MASAPARNKTSQKASPTDILDHWPKLIEKLQYSPQEFYSKIELALQERQVLDLKIARVDWPEGGILADRREYLRVTRERLIFDVCGAPRHGIFLSVWVGEKPLKLGALVGCFLIVAVITFLEWAFPFAAGLHRLMFASLGVSYQSQPCCYSALLRRC